jgi:2-polyprenyl-6-methoxyphenol hydroxylase-like FAD-dependent oxidoreductase
MAPTDPPRFDAVVHGDGVVGRAAALALAAAGLVVGHARPAPPGGRPVAAPGALGPAVSPGASTRADVRTFALNAASVALLSRLRVWDSLPADARTAVHEMRVHGDAEGAALAFSAYGLAVPVLAWIVDAAALEAALGDALRFSPHVHACDTGAAAPLAVHAEGRGAAATRAALGVAMERRAYGQRAVATRLVGDRPHANTARQWFRSPDVLALLPFDRPAAGASWGLVWSVPEARAEALLAMPEAAFAAALADATGGEVGALELAAPRAAWPLAIARAEPMAGLGWVLVGDAAHEVHPLAGQGLNLGLADVATLAEVLAAREAWRSPGDARLLARFARRRHAPTRAMGAVTDGLLHLFAHEAPFVKALRNRGLAAVERLAPLKRALAARAFGG